VGIRRLHWGAIAYLGVLILGVVVGVLVGGGTGTTITAIAAALLAITLLAVGGVRPPSRASVARRLGRPFEDEDQRDPRD
jgi:predicted lipid-binding transport protein (Tim44 family)